MHTFMAGARALFGASVPVGAALFLRVAVGASCVCEGRGVACLVSSSRAASARRGPKASLKLSGGVLRGLRGARRPSRRGVWLWSGAGLLWGVRWTATVHERRGMAHWERAAVVYRSLLWRRPPLLEPLSSEGGVSSDVRATPAHALALALALAPGPPARFFLPAPRRKALG